MPPKAVRPAHVEHDFLVRQQLVVQPQVVAVGVELLLVERIDDDVPVQPRPNLVAAENHVWDRERAGDCVRFVKAETKVTARKSPCNGSRGRHSLRQGADRTRGMPKWQKSPSDLVIREARFYFGLKVVVAVDAVKSPFSSGNTS